MSWVWDQSAGALYRDGKLISRGYAGKGRGRNNPGLQGVRGVGPIPRGRYAIKSVADSPNTGKFTITVHAIDATPNDDRHDETGRSAFRIHGDNARGDFSASSGCIILPRNKRELIWRSGDRILEVIE